MPSPFKRRVQPAMQDIDPLLFTHKLRRQHQDVRIPMLARQLGYLLIPCQRRTHVGVAVGRVRHAQTCTTSEHSALHFARTYRTRDRLGIVGIVVGRVELLGPNIDGLVPELLQLIHKPVLEVEPDVIGSYVDLLSHRTPQTADGRRLTAQTKFCLTLAIAAMRRSASRSAARYEGIRSSAAMSNTMRIVS